MSAFVRIAGEWVKFLVSPSGLIIVAICVGVILVMGWRSGCTDAREARQEQRQAEARTESAVNAIKEITALEARGQATDAEVEQAHEAIRQADPADRDAVARAHLCRLQHRPDCPGL